MPRPVKTFTAQERRNILDAWAQTGTVEKCRKVYADLAGLERPPSWDTMRRWLNRLAIRPDPTKVVL